MGLDSGSQLASNEFLHQVWMGGNLVARMECSVYLLLFLVAGCALYAFALGIVEGTLKKWIDFEKAKAEEDGQE